MKQIKRCAGLVLALVMVFSMALTAQAAETLGSITISGTTKDKVYEIYKIFDLTKGSGTAVAYTIDSDWTAFFAGVGADYITDTQQEGLNAITVDGKTKYIQITEDNKEQFVKAALEWAVGLTADSKQTAQEDSLSFEDLPLGYYLVYPQGASEIKEGYGSICSLTSTVPTASVVVKADYPTITKQDDTVSADVGQRVTYTITGKVPDTTGYQTYEYTIEDVMTDGLTFQKDVVVKFEDKTIAVDPDYETTANGFSVTFDMTKWQDHVGQTITVTYSAVVNENAVEEGTVEKNKATLTYDHDPKDNTQKTTTPPVEEKVYSSQIVVDKVDGENNAQKLAGAQFVLLNSEGKYYKLEGETVSWVAEEENADVVTTDANGAASFTGLKNGTYQLKEIKAPDGYNLLTKTVEVTVDGEEKNGTSISAVCVVENNSGTTLPSTGGAGTTAIYIGGSLLVLLSGILLILRKRTKRV